MVDNTNGRTSNRKGHTWIWYGVPVVVLIAVLALWFFYVKGPAFVPGANISDKGQFGDMFGALNSLFSALALVAIVFTISLQLKELRDQQRDLRRTEELQRESAEALKKQAESNELSTKLSALDSIIQAVSRQIEHCNGEAPDLPFLKLELNSAIGDLRNLIRIHDVFPPGLADSSVNNAPLTQDDIVELIPKYITYLGGDEVRPQSARLCSQFARFGVNTRTRLQQVLSSQDVIRKIESLYVDELFRPPTRPLDPSAVAQWVVMLFIDPHKSKDIRNALRSSRERKEKDSFTYPSFNHDGHASNVSQPVIVVSADNTVQGYPNFKSVRDVMADWQKQDPNSTSKYKVFYFDFDEKSWKEHPILMKVFC